jgi:ribosome-associated protein
MIQAGSIIPALTSTWLIAAQAADAKKASDVKVLDLREMMSFTDHFVLATGGNPRQVQAIADEVGQQVAEQEGRKPLSVEGYKNAEWVLIDYGDLVVHIFSEPARRFYDLERLWRTAKEIDFRQEKAS